jgi:YD repeat-containing protein
MEYEDEGIEVHEEYDANGNKTYVKFIESGVEIWMEYDKNNRIISNRDSTGKWQKWTYLSADDPINGISGEWENYESSNGYKYCTEKDKDGNIVYHVEWYNTGKIICEVEVNYEEDGSIITVFYDGKLTTTHKDLLDNIISTKEEYIGEMMIDSMNIPSI